jgi:hypothetical protein
MDQNLQQENQFSTVRRRIAVYISANALMAIIQVSEDFDELLVRDGREVLIKQSVDPDMSGRILTHVFSLYSSRKLIRSAGATGTATIQRPGELLRD